MDIMELLRNTKTPIQVVGRLSVIRQLQERRHLKLTKEDLERLIDRCVEICHKHDINLEVVYEDPEDDED